MTPTATAVLDDIDAVLDSAAAARHDAVMAGIPDLEPIPGPWDVLFVLHRDAWRDDDADDDAADYWQASFEVAGIRYDRQYNMSVAHACPMIWIRPDYYPGLSAARKSYLAADLDYRDAVWIYDPITCSRMPVASARPGDKVTAVTYRYPGEGWVW